MFVSLRTRLEGTYRDNVMFELRSHDTINVRLRPGASTFEKKSNKSQRHSIHCFDRACVAYNTPKNDRYTPPCTRDRRRDECNSIFTRPRVFRITRCLLSCLRDIRENGAIIHRPAFVYVRRGPRANVDTYILLRRTHTKRVGNLCGS